MLAYCSMQARVRGQVPQSARWYAGLPIMSREEFMVWAEKDPTYPQLHAAWAAAGYPHRLTPTVDRIDHSRGYVKGNVRWLTKSANCSRPRRRLKRAA